MQKAEQSGPDAGGVGRGHGSAEKGDFGCHESGGAAKNSHCAGINRLPCAGNHLVLTGMPILPDNGFIELLRIFRSHVYRPTGGNHPHGQGQQFKAVQVPSYPAGFYDIAYPV